MGAIVGDLNSRPRSDRLDGGARQLAGHPRDRAAGTDVWICDEMRSMTQGRATYTMQFARYEEVPPGIAEEIMAKVAGKPPARAGSR